MRVPIPAIDLRSLALAWRQESSWQQKALSVVSTALLPSKAQQAKQSLQARLRHLDEQLLIGGTAESGAPYEVLSPAELIKKAAKLEKRMLKHARDLEFEDAATLRDEIHALRAAGLGIEEKKAG